MKVNNNKYNGNKYINYMYYVYAYTIVIVLFICTTLNTCTIAKCYGHNGGKKVYNRHCLHKSRIKRRKKTIKKKRIKNLKKAKGKVK